jgi:hypothetical protein
MARTRIAVVQLGQLRLPVDVRALESWSSALLQLRCTAGVGHLPNAEGDEWQYTDGQLAMLLQEEDEADLTLGLIDAPLEDNYYLRRLSERTAVLSFYQMADIAQKAGCGMEQYVLRNAYELTVLSVASGSLLPHDADTWAHDETRGCLFDMNASKYSIVHSLDRPNLCEQCRARVSRARLPQGFLQRLERELRLVRRPLYERLSSWVRSHPILALSAAAGGSILLNVTASVLFEVVRARIGWP